MDNPIMLIGVGILCAAFTAWLIALFMNATKNTKLLEAQTTLLIKMARQQGVSDEELHEISNGASLPIV